MSTFTNPFTVLECHEGPRNLPRRRYVVSRTSEILYYRVVNHHTFLTDSPTSLVCLMDIVSVRRVTEPETYYSVTFTNSVFLIPRHELFLLSYVERFLKDSVKMSPKTDHLGIKQMRDPGQEGSLLWCVGKTVSTRYRLRGFSLPGVLLSRP